MKINLSKSVGVNRKLLVACVLLTSAGISAQSFSGECDRFVTLNGNVGNTRSEQGNMRFEGAPSDSIYVPDSVYTKLTEVLKNKKDKKKKERTKHVTLYLSFGHSTLSKGYKGDLSDKFSIKIETPFFPRISKNLFFDFAPTIYEDMFEYKETGETIGLVGFMFPVNIGYRFTVNEKVKFYVKTGYWVQYAFSANTDQPSEDDIGYLFSDVFNKISHENMGMNFEAGTILFRHLEISTGYELGLYDMNVEEPARDICGNIIDKNYKHQKITSGNFFVSAGFRF